MYEALPDNIKEEDKLTQNWANIATNGAFVAQLKHTTFAILLWPKYYTLIAVDASTAIQILNRVWDRLNNFKLRVISIELLV